MLKDNWYDMVFFYDIYFNIKRNNYWIWVKNYIINGNCCILELYMGIWGILWFISEKYKNLFIYWNLKIFLDFKKVLNMLMYF